jgi:hypothetical protein
MNKAFLNFHSWLLIIAGLLGAIASTTGYFFGKGPFKFLVNQNIGIVGLFEAYLLAAVCGVILLAGINSSSRGQWHRMAALVHVPLIVTNILFWDFYGSYDIISAGIIATIIHMLLVLIELFIYFKNKKA